MSEGLKMKNVSKKYIDKALKNTGLKRKELAPLIGVSEQQMSNLNNGSELKDESLILLAQFAQTPSHKILAEKHMKTAKGAAEKGFWRAIASSKELAERSKDYILCSIQNDIKIF